MCDTIVATGRATSDGSVILAKNSDREPNEVQLLNHMLPQKYNKNDVVRCTYITIPQAAKTNEIFISRPFWMWGCEMGVNSHGLAIGNEAVFTREPYARTGLTGMDLIRLALERTASAPEALSLITELIGQYGQGGNCGYRNKLFYHNSFIIADKKEAWVLETAGSHWAAEKVNGVRSISNGLTIGEKYTLASKGIEEYARRKGYIKKNEAFDFRKAFSDTLITHFSRCSVRQGRTSALLGEHSGKITPLEMMKILRDHGASGSGTPPHRTYMGTVCMHASFGPLRASQSTSALVAHLRDKNPVYWATGTSGTCTGVFKPFYLTGKTIAFLNPDAGAKYSRDILWWRHETLHRRSLLNYSFWNGSIAPERDEIEESFFKAERKMSSGAAAKGKSGTAKLPAFSESCFNEADKKVSEWTSRIKKAGKEKGIPLLYRYFWNRQNRLASLPEE